MTFHPDRRVDQPGQLGRPAVQSDGEVIGINTAISRNPEGSVGIGFAISSNLAKRVTQQLAEYGTTRRGWLGVFIQEVTPEIMNLWVSTRLAARWSVRSTTRPARRRSRAGRRHHQLRWQEDREDADLPRIVAETDIGATVDVELVRNGSQMTVQVRSASWKRPSLSV